MANTIRDIIATGEADAVAVAAPGRRALSYRALADQVEQTVYGMNARGIGRNDRVAIVLPNGPEMATAFWPLPPAPQRHR